jgi:hypothetical protein
VIDLRDSVSVYKKIRPILVRQRTIAGSLDGSLSEALQKEKVDIALASQITKVYAWSIDFFKLKKGDKFGITFTERYIDDTIYDGVDSLKAAFFEYKGKKIYAFPFAQNPNSQNSIILTKTERRSRISSSKHRSNTSTSPRDLRRTACIRCKVSGNPQRHRLRRAHRNPHHDHRSGVVEQTGYTAGNGNFVKVKHDKTYATQYLHMSKILVGAANV